MAPTVHSRFRGQIKLARQSTRADSPGFRATDDRSDADSHDPLLPPATTLSHQGLRAGRCPAVCLP